MTGGGAGCDLRGLGSGDGQLGEPLDELAETLCIPCHRVKTATEDLVPIRLKRSKKMSLRAIQTLASDCSYSRAVRTNFAQRTEAQLRDEAAWTADYIEARLRESPDV